MRRKDREITQREELLRILNDCDVCRLAFHDGDYPYILPLNFGMEERDGVLTLYFHGAAEGYKYTVMARDNRASFEADCAHRLVYDGEKRACTMEYESVIGRGRAFRVEDGEEKLRALRLLMRHYRRGEESFPPEVVARTAVFKLTVESMTGKRRMKPTGGAHIMQGAHTTDG